MPAVVCKYSCITETDIKVFLTLCNYINISKNFFKDVGYSKLLCKFAEDKISCQKFTDKQLSQRLA